MAPASSLDAQCRPVNGPPCRVKKRFPAPAVPSSVVLVWRLLQGDRFAMISSETIVAPASRTANITSLQQAEQFQEGASGSPLAEWVDYPHHYGTLYGPVVL
jgi:hypothetical protein